MTTIRQLIQTGPAKANELFAKLGDTSENAVKTASGCSRISRRSLNC